MNVLKTLDFIDSNVACLSVGKGVRPVKNINEIKGFEKLSILVGQQ